MGGCNDNSRYDHRRADPYRLYRFRACAGLCVLGRDPPHAPAERSCFAGRQPDARKGAWLTGLTSRHAALHVAAAAVGLIVFAAILTYTGDTDLLLAVKGGLGIWLLLYLTVHLLRDAPVEK